MQQFDAYGRPTVATGPDGTQAQVVYGLDSADRYDHLDLYGDDCQKDTYSTQRVDGLGRTLLSISRDRESKEDCPLSLPANKIGESRRDGMTKGILTMDSSGKLFGKTRDCPHVATVSDSNRLNSSELDTLNQFLCSEKNRFSEIIADADVDIECGIVFKTLNLFFRTAACTDRIIITEGAPLCGK